MFSDERGELHATLESQDTFVRRATVERQRLRNEAARLKQVMQAKDQVIRWVKPFSVVNMYQACGNVMHQHIHKRALYTVTTERMSY